MDSFIGIVVTILVVFALYRTIRTHNTTGKTYRPQPKRHSLTKKSSADNVIAFFKKLDLESIASEAELAQIVQEKNIEKFDELLPPNLLCEGYGRRMFDVGGTKAWIAQNFHCKLL